MKTTKYIAAMSLICASVLYGEMVVDFLTLDAESGAPFYYGYGYDSVQKRFKRACVEFDSNATHDAGQRGGSKSDYTLVENNYEIAENAQLTAKASIKAATTSGKVKIENKTDLVGSTDASTYNITLFAYAYHHDPAEVRHIQSVRFVPRYREMLEDPGRREEFRQMCGDGFVIGIQRGSEFFGTATVKRQNLKQSTKLASTTGIGVKSGVYDTQGSLDISKTIESIFGSNNFDIKVYSTGSTHKNPTSIDELKSMYQTFNETSQGQKKIIRYVIMPYNFVADYPYSDPFHGDSKDEALGHFARALWSLRAAIKDADLVISPTTSDLFALGTTPFRRQVRIGQIKKYRDVWKREFDKLAKAARKCQEEFDNECLKLANLYSNRNISDISYQVMPERYLDDCQTPVEIDMRDLSTFTTALGQLRGPFDVVEGDGETGGNNVRVTALLDFDVEGQREQGTLKGMLSVARTEWRGPKYLKGHDGRLVVPPIAVRVRGINAGDSVFARMARMDIFNFSDNSAINPELVERTFKSCAWRDPVRPLAAKKIYGPISRVRPLDPYGFTYGKRPWVYGVVDAYSKKDARGQINFGPGKGLLKLVRCEVDRPGRRDYQAGCDDVQIESFRLDLVSSQDRVADSWKDPQLASIPPELDQFLVGHRLAIPPLKLQARPVYRLPSSDLQQIRQKMLLKPDAIKKFKPVMRIKKDQ